MLFPRLLTVRQNFPDRRIPDVAAEVQRQLRNSDFAARLKPGDAGVRNSLGMLLAGAGRLDEAMVEYAEALRIQPNFEAARRGLEAAKAKRDAGR